jgi:hypothetical protein
MDGQGFFFSFFAKNQARELKAINFRFINPHELLTQAIPASNRKKEEKKSTVIHKNAPPPVQTE